MTLQWFRIVDTARDNDEIGRILVISGRIGSHSWGLSYIGRIWTDELSRMQGINGWKVEEMREPRSPVQVTEGEKANA